MTLGPLSRVMMVKPPFHAQNVENSCFLCAKFSPGQPGQQLHCPGFHSNPVYPPVDWVSPPCLEVCDRHGDFSLAAVSGGVSPTGRFSLGKTSKEKNIFCLSFRHCPKVASTRQVPYRLYWIPKEFRGGPRNPINHGNEKISCILRHL